MPVTASQLRADVYRLLDDAIRTGEPILVERRGVLVRIVPPPKQHWLDRMPRRDTIVGDPEALVSNDWSEAWSPDLP